MGYAHGHSARLGSCVVPWLWAEQACGWGETWAQCFQYPSGDGKEQGPVGPIPGGAAPGGSHRHRGPRHKRIWWGGGRLQASGPSPRRGISGISVTGKSRFLGPRGMDRCQLPECHCVLCTEAALVIAVVVFIDHISQEHRSLVGKGGGVLFSENHSGSHSLSAGETEQPHGPSQLGSRAPAMACSYSSAWSLWCSCTRVTMTHCPVVPRTRQTKQQGGISPSKTYAACAGCHLEMVAWCAAAAGCQP